MGLSAKVASAILRLNSRGRYDGAVPCQRQIVIPSEVEESGQCGECVDFSTLVEMTHRV